ncbi:hypothetical protein PV10_03966 [Exophiala mesophila]|uniref:Zn(2)-C6 fungal-type domain-containing protein n=1 Tax=Exophiala mesophila TaxID=212818 RepID=A0A0D1ZFN8_EXOME|nr:uncharacterized protein PV10_03966 [Exophiala mesophila]KIV92694.1 hypothetical protein PV10_03966 [Exophiala mesophila]
MSPTEVNPVLGNSRLPRVAPGRSCIACRKRKIRCDRIQPCGYCTKIRVQCVYPTPEHEVLKPPADDVLARLRRIEASMARLEARGAIETSPENQPTPDHHLISAPGNGMNKKETLPQSGRLLVEQGDTRFVNGSFWNALEDEAELQELPSESSSVQQANAASSSIPLTAQPNENLNNHYQRFIFGMSISPNPGGLAHLHPPEAKIFSLWQIYLENVDPLLKLLHVPTTQCQLLRATGHLAAIPPPMEALMFAIYYAAVTSLQCPMASKSLLFEERSVLLDRYRTGIECSLARANFMITPDVPTLQALTLWLICARQAVDKTYVWSLVGLLHRLATKLGLHRDPATLGLPPFMAEMRRRLWWHICILDVRTAEDNDMDPLICEHNFDTKYPSNANDSDLDLDMTNPLGENHNRTEMLFCFTRFDISYAARKVVFSQKFTVDNGYAILNLAEKTSFIDALLKELDDKHLKYCDKKIPICFLTLTASRLILAKMKLTIHRPSRNNSSTLTEEQKEDLVNSSIDIIEYAHDLRSNDKYSRWVWLFQQYVEWDAVAFLLHSLGVSRRPSHDGRAWAAIDGFFRDWKDHIPNGLRERRWQKLLSLLAQAKANRGDDSERGIPYEPGVRDSPVAQHRVNPTDIPDSHLTRSQRQNYMPGVGTWESSMHISDNDLVPRPTEGLLSSNFNQAELSVPPSSTDNVAVDWNFDNIPYSTHSLVNWEMDIDDTGFYSWL